MKELLEALTPYPLVLGVVLGLLVAGAAAYAIRLGMRDNQKKQESQLDMDELRARWAVYTQLEHMHENSFAMVKLLEKLLETQTAILAATNRAADRRWNIGQ